eukprot:EG_transcript_43715
MYQKNEPTVRLYREQQARHGAGAPYYALKWGRAWTTGVYNNAEGHWDKFCNRTDPTRDCVPIAPRLYPSPFNDSSLPLSVFIFDPVYRACLRDGTGAPCRYNTRLLPHPERLPHNPFDKAARPPKRTSVRRA